MGEARRVAAAAVGAGAHSASASRAAATGRPGNPTTSPATCARAPSGTGSLRFPAGVLGHQRSPLAAAVDLIAPAAIERGVGLDTGSVKLLGKLGEIGVRSNGHALLSSSW